jgi:hypothetical protein
MGRHINAPISVPNQNTDAPTASGPRPAAAGHGQDPSQDPPQVEPSNESANLNDGPGGMSALRGLLLRKIVALLIVLALVAAIGAVTAGCSPCGTIAPFGVEFPDHPVGEDDSRC